MPITNAKVNNQVAGTSAMFPQAKLVVMTASNSQASLVRMASVPEVAKEA